MFQLPECKEWQVCTPELSQVCFFYLFILQMRSLSKNHKRHTFSVFRIICVYYFCLSCCCLGFHVRLLLLGPLHGKRLHHAGSGLPEIHEQPGQV